MNQVFACLGRLREAEGLSWGAGEGRQGSSAGCAETCTRLALCWKCSTLAVLHCGLGGSHGNRDSTNEGLNTGL